MAKTRTPKWATHRRHGIQLEMHWQRLVERWKARGLPKSTFCEREGISDASLH